VREVRLHEPCDLPATKRELFGRMGHGEDAYFAKTP
jgi:hypothetical protein